MRQLRSGIRWGIFRIRRVSSNHLSEPPSVTKHEETLNHGSEKKAMRSNEKVWYYPADENSSSLSGPFTISELDFLRSEGKLSDFTQCYTAEMAKQGPMAQPIIYMMLPRLDAEFSPTVEEFCAARTGKPVTVLSGPNNCGKTLLLKQVWSLVGQDGYLLGCNRFYHIDVLNSRKNDLIEFHRLFENFSRTNDTAQQNTENNELQLEQIITSLNNSQRGKLFCLCENLLGNNFSLQRTQVDNDFSPFYIDMDGENLRYGSTGTRLLLTLLGVLLNDRFSVVLLDEPELGLNPRIQSVLARFMYDAGERQKFCPHLKQLYISTHSHLLLDRGSLSNNFALTKAGPHISIGEIQTVADFHRLQFAMLGNDLESIFLPSAIVMAEGMSDVTFLTKAIRLHIPDRSVSVVKLGGEGNLLERIRFLGDAFGDFRSSPYRDRTFVLLDKTRSTRRDRIVALGVPEDNIAILSKNGIEYYYPLRLISNRFRCTASELVDIQLEKDPIEYNDIRFSKRALAESVSEGLLVTDQLDSEVDSFIQRIKLSTT